MTDPQTIAANPAPLTASQRLALSRRRRREDIMFVGIDVLPTERDALIGIGFLDKAARNNNSSAG